jgi:Sulfotransferase family
VLADAQRNESLTDWGPGEFEYPLGVLLADYAVADLNAVGMHILRSGVVHSLRMRLRAHAWIRRHPEILSERIAAPVVVVGMMRSGTTLLQRLLAVDPRFNYA